MENKKTKNHKENWIGNIIRGFLLFMPLLAIGITCAYAIFNKNAYQSYEQVNTTQSYKATLTNTNNIIPNTTYRIKYDTTQQGTNAYSPKFSYSYLSLNVADYGWNPNINYVSIRVSDTNWIQLFDEQGTSYIKYNLWGTQITEFDLVLTAIDSPTGAGFAQPYVIYTYKQSLENVFYYSIDKVQQSPLFNWATDTGMYNVIHGACTTIGIESTFVPFLLSYWLITYLIYIIYDIALLIVNMAHNRIHDVESSI